MSLISDLRKIRKELVAALAAVDAALSNAEVPQWPADDPPPWPTIGPDGIEVLESVHQLMAAAEWEERHGLRMADLTHPDLAER